MSNIISKPFSWANKIVQAVFKGSPNLITTSDLNRQIEAIKKEMYMLYMSDGNVLSDFSFTIEGQKIKTTGTYIYCSGVLFNMDMTGEYTIPDFGSESTKVLNLYAKNKLVTSDDDFSKTISGAKFDDGTTMPAAEHYVYEEPTFVFEDAKDTSDIDYAQVDERDFLVTLMKVQCINSGNRNNYFYVQTFCKKVGGDSGDLGNRRLGGLVDVSNVDYQSDSSYPHANDSLRDVVKKLWTRLYSLEKRLFAETLESSALSPDYYYVNDQQFSWNRSGSWQESNNTTFGNVTVTYDFRIVGNICFLCGHISIEKNTGESLNTTLALSLGSNNRPPAGTIRYTHIKWPVSVGPDDETFVTKVKGWIDSNKLIFCNIPTSGYEGDYSITYCIISGGFWKYDPSDKQSNFEY